MFAHAEQGIQDRIDDIVAENKLPAGLHRAERICSSEGEVWWKVHVNAEVAPVALIEWLSRLDVVPLFYGDRLLACAYVTERKRATMPGGDQHETYEQVWRHAEVHTHGRVVHKLYLGTNTQLGNEVPLTALEMTAELPEEWAHGLDMLAGRIVNDLDDTLALGESDYDQVFDELLALNEAMTIATENARLTGQDRIFAAGRFTRSDGSFDSSLQVFQVETEGGTLGESDSRPPIVAVEKHYDAVPLWMHISKLVGTILTRVGLVPQFIGEQVDGQAESGTAIRLRFLPTVNAATGKAREWDGTLPHILDLLLRVGAIPTEQGGLGQGSYEPQEPPTVERGDVLPVDEAEDVTTHATAVQGEIESRETAVKALHPDWSQDEVDAELRRIREDIGLATPELPPPPPGAGA